VLAALRRLLHGLVGNIVELIEERPGLGRRPPIRTELAPCLM
jgi:hypothetical protein